MNAGGLRPEGLGARFRQERVAQGISQETLARELRLSLRLITAIESDQWEAIPPGRERPLARQVARRLGIDLAAHADLWEQLPGAVAAEAPDPRQERTERVLATTLTLGCVAVATWLVVPGRSLRTGLATQRDSVPSAPPAPWVPRAPEGPYPVLGELLPEAPVNEEGVLVALRAIDAAGAVIHQESGSRQIPLRVSEPWSGRVKGPFTLRLENAGVVALEVAGRGIPHGQRVGQAWEGRFDAAGQWLRPPAPPAPPPSAPEAPPEPDEVQP